MFRKTLSKIGLAVMGIVVALTACQLETTQDKNAVMPVFSIEGAVDYNDTVTIKTETEGADIFYTTDGSAPTAESTKYTGPVAITADCTIKAVAVKSGMQNSIIAEKSFTVKKYTVTFNANGHGTAPGAISGKHKGEVIALPAALSATGFTFGGWSDGTNTYAAGANYTVSGDVTLKAVWTQMPTYTVTFDANGHGTAPRPMTGYKTQQITLPQAITASGWLFNNWSDGTNTYAAGATYTVTGNVTLRAVWTKVVNPVTNLTATCTASGTVKLTWTNPTDDDFAKVVITYGTSGSETVLKNASPNNEKIITGLTDGNEYTFTVKAYDDAENVSSGVSVNKTPVSFGGLQGTPTGGQTQGTVIKESWMDPTSGNIKINDTAIAKTSEIIAIPAGTVAAVTMPNDTSWITYYRGLSSYYKGVFLSGRKVKLDPFVMSQYEVTQKLYMEVMGLTEDQNPSYCKNNPDGGETQENRPVEWITWYQACAFCNELTKKTFGNTTNQCVYYSDEQCTTPYTITDGNNSATVYPAYDTTNHKWTKTGYRLPTEAEWEFCARGGNPNAVDVNNKSIWSYAYAGVQTSKQPTGFTSGSTDTPLNDYAWYNANGNGKTHEVGKKSPNTLGLYDMSGNVLEWCYDRYGSTATSNDAAYTTDGNVVNPLGLSDMSYRVRRGGCYNSLDACLCAVSYRSGENPSSSDRSIGFRLVRSISN